MGLPQFSDLGYKEGHPKDIQDLVDRIHSYYPNADLSLVHKSYDMARQAHVGQYRKDGSHFISHPLCVASILADLKLDLHTIITGLLHDVVEDTEVDLKEIEKEFNSVIAFLVDGVSKVSRIRFKNTQQKASENMRKMIVAMAKDVRVILVKLADRLHNMRTLFYMPREKQLSVAQETLELYAPLASRLGIHSVKVELEDLAFCYSDPESYHLLVEKMDSGKKEMEKYILKVMNILKKEIASQTRLRIEITGRPKNLYSIHQKMIKQHVDYNEVYDILAFRICVNKVEECYKILGIIHSLWKPIPGRFKDFIAIPKPNNYQSLHTTVIGEGGKRIEIQIRTFDMHLLADKGIAAHWKYKSEAWDEHQLVDDKTLKQFNWLHDLVSLHQQNTNSSEFLESVKMNLFDCDIYLFTPGGDVKEFPIGASPIDFAYGIHTDLGHQISGAKVNGRLVPFKTKLQNGDTVEVITSKNQIPSDEWLQHCVTSRAKSKIKSFLNMERQKQAIKIGQNLFEKALKSNGIRLDVALKDTKIHKFMKRNGIMNKEGLYSQLGYGKILIKNVLSILIPEQEDVEKIKEIKENILSRPLVQKETTKNFCSVIVDGMGNIMVNFAKCCRPLPGDALLGFISRGRGIIVHRHSCQSLLSMDSDRYVNVQWNEKQKETHRYTVLMKIVCHDGPGVLKNISEVFAENNVNITNLKVDHTKELRAICVFYVEVKNLEQLQTLIRSIKNVKNIISVFRWI